MTRWGYLEMEHLIKKIASGNVESWLIKINIITNLRCVYEYLKI